MQALGISATCYSFICISSFIIKKRRQPCSISSSLHFFLWTYILSVAMNKQCYVCFHLTGQCHLKSRQQVFIKRRKKNKAEFTTHDQLYSFCFLSAPASSTKNIRTNERVVIQPVVLVLRAFFIIILWEIGMRVIQRRYEHHNLEEEKKERKKRRNRSDDGRWRPPPTLFFLIRHMHTHKIVTSGRSIEHLSVVIERQDDAPILINKVVIENKRPQIQLSHDNVIKI